MNKDKKYTLKKVVDAEGKDITWSLSVVVAFGLLFLSPFLLVGWLIKSACRLIVKMGSD